MASTGDAAGTAGPPSSSSRKTKTSKASQVISVLDIEKGLIVALPGMGIMSKLKAEPGMSWEKGARDVGCGMWDVGRGVVWQHAPGAKEVDSRRRHRGMRHPGIKLGWLILVI